MNSIYKKKKKFIISVAFCPPRKTLEDVKLKRLKKKKEFVRFLQKDSYWKS